MASLPENWEWDYDGTRWFYRYKPTGLVQYTFPKPGDEFPEFVDFSSSADLAPEEKLVSQQQIKRRSTLGESSKQAAATTRRARATSNAISDPDDGAAPFWLQPDGLMYMGPGAYNDISPLQEEEDERGHDSVQADEKDNADRPTPGSTAVADTTTSPDFAKTTPATVSTVATPNQAVVLPARAHISPVVSAETTPHVINSQPAVATPELDSTAVVEVIQAAPVGATVVHEPEVPLLDSRQVPYNPIGFVAELASELTARCDDEINPAPVEMPSNEIMMDTSEPLPYANAFHFAPAELASDEAPARRTATRNAVEDKSLASQHPSHERVQEQQQKAYQAVQDLLNRPYKPAAQTSLPQPATALTQTPNPHPDPAPAKFQPYNPSRHAAFAPDVNRYSTVEPRGHQPIVDNKRHSLAGPALSQHPPSDVPPALQVPQLPPKLPLDSASTSGPTVIPGSGARHESISGPAPKGASGNLAHFPSILQPARGRPVIRAQSPPQSQGGSPARTYQAYKPYHDLQRDIEDTVQLLSKTGYGHGPAVSSESSSSGRPQISRTSTLPAHLPALPYMGVRPHLPPSVASEPVTLRDLQPRPAHPGEPGGSTSSGGEAGMVILQEYSAPLPPSSPDLPQPLNLARKSPPPHSSIPTSTPSRPPVTVEPDMTSRVVTPAPLNTMVVSGPVLASPVHETLSHQNNMGGVCKTQVNVEQTGVVVQADTPAAPSLAHSISPQHEGTKNTTSSAQTPPAVHAPPEHVISSGFSVMVDSSVLAAPQVTPTVQPPVQPETVSQPAPATSFAVNVADVQPLSRSETQTSLPAEENPAAKPSSAETHFVVADWQPGPSSSKVVLQGMSKPTPSQPPLTASGDARNPSHIISDYIPTVQSQQQPSEQPRASLPTAQPAHVQDSRNPQVEAPVISDCHPAVPVHQQTPSPQTLRQPDHQHVQTWNPASNQNGAHIISDQKPAVQVHHQPSPQSIVGQAPNQPIQTEVSANTPASSHVISDYPPAVQGHHHSPPQSARRQRDPAPPQNFSNTQTTSHVISDFSHPTQPHRQPLPPQTVSQPAHKLVHGQGFENTQDSSHAISDSPPGNPIHHQPPQPAARQPAGQFHPLQKPNLPIVSPSPAPTVERQPSVADPGNRLASQHGVTPLPSVTPRPPSPRTPSPLSRASSPPTQQNNVPQHNPIITPLAAPMTSVQQNPGPAGQVSVAHGRIDAPTVALPASTTASSPPPLNGTSVAGPSVPVYTIPSGHHPLASHPVNVSPPRHAEPLTSKTSDQLGTGGHAGQHLPSGAAAQSGWGAQPQAHTVTQASVGIAQPAVASNQQQPAQAAPVPTLTQSPAQNSIPGQGQPNAVPRPPVPPQGPASSHAPVSSQGQAQPVTQSPALQASSATGQAQISAQPVGQVLPTPIDQGQAAAMPSGPGQAPHNMPLRTYSHPLVSQSAPLPHPGAPGTAPPQMHMMYAPPPMAPGMPPQGAQPGMLPPQQFAFQPSMFPQAGPGMQYQQMTPHMMPPSQMQGGPYVMRQPQPAQPVKEEKSWFGKLWRSDSVKKPTPSVPVNPVNRLQKAPGARPQAPLAFPPQLHPNHPVPQPQFAPPVSQMPPHMMMQSSQQAQQLLNTQQRQQGIQQQQQQPQQPQQPQQQPQQPQQPQGPPQFQQQQQQQQQQQGTQQFQQQQQQQPLQFQPPQQQQQQQQQPLAWKTTNGPGQTGSGNQMPQFQAPGPHHNPNQPIMPPAHVRQAIQQQEQHLKQGQGHRQSVGPGMGMGMVPGQVGAGQNGGGNGNAVVPAQGGNPVKATASVGKGAGGGWGAASASNGYDGSGWGDEDDDDGGYR